MDIVTYHKHNGVDSPQIDISDILMGDSASSAPFVSLTADESIAKNDIACVVPPVITVYAGDATYIRDNPSYTSTNFGTSEELKTGMDSSGYNYIALLKFDMADVPAVGEIIRAELVMRVTSVAGTPPAQSVSRVTSSWAEGTVTYATSPSSANDVLSGYLTAESFTASTDGESVMDITQLLRQWKGGAITNYGIKITGSSSAGVNATYASDDHATTSYRPQLRIYRSVGIGTIGLANSANYERCRTIIGAAQSAVASGGRAIINYSLCGIGDINYVGSPLYLSETAGGHEFSRDGLTRVIRTGKTISASQSLLNVQDRDVLVEAYSPNTQSNKTIYVPDDVRYATIYFRYDSASDQYFMIRADRHEQAVWNALPNMQFTWEDDHIVITASSNYYLEHIYFYN